MGVETHRRDCRAMTGPSVSISPTVGFGLRDPLAGSAQLREAGVALAEDTHDEHRPPVADAVQDVTGRAVRATGAAAKYGFGPVGYHRVPTLRRRAALIR
ncbi:hypothetical protein GCM10010358_82160 [Streptomyces minutiscleroticus]|uniref:Uncharacterized protein n=1 Tax=Streptomyces minutiscleroticus TaxID=68238 RepID=A0A918UAR4_9ACTN|nr:hypothetical protein GCM10010358_82160 [Streptomyces minutiscleroticus]